MTSPRQDDVRAAFERVGTVRGTARELGIAPKTVRYHLERARSQEARQSDLAAIARLSQAGYSFTAESKTPAEAWAEHRTTTDRVLSEAMRRREYRITRPRGPFALFHVTDEHIDDDATPLALLEQDVAAAKAMGAICIHGGDMLNNWPMAGRLAKLWAEQSATRADGLLRLIHYLQLLQPDVATLGNHEEMNPYLVDLIKTHLPKTCVYDYWRVDFTVDTPDGRPVRVNVSHKFQKGSSWFHPHHGVIRESMEAEPADVYLEGHLHVAGAMYRTFPERGHSFLAVSSAGYKVLDKFAARISRGGKTPKLKGRCHWIVCDPQTEDGHLAVAYDCPAQAEAALSALQNLRAV